VDRYLASLRASSPTYEDPYASWGGARPALQYGLPPEQPRPDTTDWTTPLADYGMGHAPAGMPAMGAPPPVNTGPGGPRPSTPGGTILPGGGGGDARRGAAAFGITDPRAAQRFDAWVDAAHGMGLDYGRAEATAAGGIRWAEENEPADQRGWARSGANLSSYAPNTLNPAQAVSFYGRGGAPNQYQLSGRADVGGNARNLTSIAPPGQAIPDAAGYVVDPLDRAAAHITQAVTGGATGGATGGTTGGATMASDTGGMRPGNYQQGGTPGYAPATGAGGGVPPGGGLGDVNAGYLLDPQNRAALQAYIAQRGGVSPSTHSLLGNYIYDTVAPMFSSALTSLGLDTPGGLQGNIDQWFQQGRGNTLFSSLRNAAQQRLGSGGFASDLAALGDPRAQAGLLNQLINLTNTGQSALHRAATQQQLIDRQRQFELQSALSQDPTQLGNYMQYFQGLPGWDRLVGGGG
jgi:hypothetical protein